MKPAQREDIDTVYFAHLPFDLRLLAPRRVTDTATRMSKNQRVSDDHQMTSMPSGELAVPSTLSFVSSSSLLGDPRPEPPQAPESWECCQSGCDPCVYDNYCEALTRHETALAAWELRQKVTPSAG